MAIVTVDTTPNGPPIPSNFLGFSLEWSGLRGYSLPAPDPRAVQLIDNLGDGVIRIGGNSEDQSCFSADGGIAKMPDGGILNGFCGTAITPSLTAALFELANATHWPLILGMNLGIDDAGVALETIHAAIVPALDAGPLLGLEIGNEPNDFPGHAVTLLGLPETMRPKDGGWTLSLDEQEFNGYVDAFKADSVAASLPVAGPAFAGGWTQDLGAFERLVTDAGADRLQLITFHRYASNRCDIYPDAGEGPAPYPDGGNAATIATLLAPSVAASWSTYVREGVNSALDGGYRPRLAEANSIACGGEAGTSDAFAAAVWATDFMFSIAEIGVTGVNFHGGGTGPYTPIAVSTVSDGGLAYAARPLYYAMLLMAQEAVGSQPVATALTGVDGGVAAVNVTAYAVESCAATCTVQVFILNKDLNASGSVRIHPPAGTWTGQVLTLTAPALDATSGITLGGAVVGADGSFPIPSTVPLAAEASGDYVVPLPPASVQVLELSP